jgi:hypothetical protein
VTGLKIEMVKSRVIFTPEDADEKAKLENLWRVMIDCVKETRKLVPIGQYVPQAGDQSASFQIEGLEVDEQSFVEVRVQEDTSVYCKTCNKLLNLKKGEVIPLCCGQPMTVVD